MTERRRGLLQALSWRRSLCFEGHETHDKPQPDSPCSGRDSNLVPLGEYVQKRYHMWQLLGELLLSPSLLHSTGLCLGYVTNVSQIARSKRGIIVNMCYMEISVSENVHVSRAVSLCLCDRTLLATESFFLPRLKTGTVLQPEVVPVYIFR
jgi:hypothetical protein